METNVRDEINKQRCKGRDEAIDIDYGHDFTNSANWYNHNGAAIYPRRS